MIRYRYTLNNDDLTKCPECGHILTVPGQGVDVWLSIHGADKVIFKTCLHYGWLLDTWEGAIAKGFHAGTHCGGCGRLLIDMEDVCEEKVDSDVGPRKTTADVQKLKQQWLRDPCWDLADTPGFEEFKEELTLFQANVERSATKEAVKQNEAANQPAFPLAVHRDTTIKHLGLTKREWMATIIASGAVNFDAPAPTLADLATELADALLTRLAKEKE